MSVKIAGIQMGCGEDKEDNVQRALRMGRLAAEKGAQIICFQELFNTHWFPRDIDEGNFLLAEGIDGPTVATMRTLDAANRRVARLTEIIKVWNAVLAAKRKLEAEKVKDHATGKYFNAFF